MPKPKIPVKSKIWLRKLPNQVDRCESESNSDPSSASILTHMTFPLLLYQYVKKLGGSRFDADDGSTLEADSQSSAAPGYYVMVHVLSEFTRMDCIWTRFRNVSFFSSKLAMQ